MPQLVSLGSILEEVRRRSERPTTLLARGDGSRRLFRGISKGDIPSH